MACLVCSSGQLWRKGKGLQTRQGSPAFSNPFPLVRSLVSSTVASLYSASRARVCCFLLFVMFSPPLSLSLLPSSLPSSSSHRSSSFLFVFFLFSFFFFRFFLLVFFRMVSLFAWQSTAAPSTPRHALSRKVRSRYHLLEFSHLLATSPWALHPPSSTGCSTTTTTTIWNREKMGPF